MIVLSIGTDRKIFEQGSAPRERMIQYGKLFTELHIIIFTRGDSFKAEKISDNVWIYPTQSKNRWKYPFDARRVFKKQLLQLKPHVITTQDPFETGVAGWLIKRIAKVPLHIQIHTDFMSKYFARESFLNKIRVYIASWLLPRAQGIRAVSDRIRDSLKDIDPLLIARTIVLPIYTDIEGFKNAPLVTDLHKHYPQFNFIILMASRLTPEKNIGVALQALKEVVIKNKDVGLVIVGDGPERRYLQALALRYHLDRNVIFESWQQNLASYYRTTDVFLTTSLYEGYGLTLVEAAACGCPIITSDVGIASTIIHEGKNGFICSVEYPHQFAERITLMVENEELRHSLQQEAALVAEKKVSVPKSEYLQKYKKMIEDVTVA